MALVAAALALAACDSDNVSWKFVSNPSGTLPAPQGGTVVVIQRASARSTPPNPRSLRFDGERDGREVHLRLSTSADAVAIESDAGVELRCPTLPEGALEVRGGTLAEPTEGAVLWEIAVHECAALHPSALGPGRLSVAARGNVVVLEHAAGLVVFGADPEPRVWPAGWAVDASSPSLQLVGPEGTHPLAGSAAPALAQRVTHGGASVGILGASGEQVVTLPAAAVRFAGDDPGVFLRADLAASDPPCTLLAATDNRYLLRIDG